ncbi:MAG: hypothetical protein GY715_22005 [Planctomycetes bacterium]|nr:hypothetical protein [Planctomycetota bacterium]
MRRKRRQRDKQAGRAIVVARGERGEILFPDRGQQPLRFRVRRYQDRPGDGFGSHRNGRHKLG